MERKIGEIFEYNGEWYQCVKGLNCSSCFLNGSGNCDKFLCAAVERTDSTPVSFKKLEKVGEPYFNGQYGEVLQEYKYYIPPITPDLRIHIIKLGIVGIEIKQNKEDMEEKKDNYDGNMDKECIPICDALNSIPGVHTTESCCGHCKDRFMIFITCNNSHSLAIIARVFNRRYIGTSQPWYIELQTKDSGAYDYFIHSETKYSGEEVMMKDVNQIIENIKYWCDDKFASHFKGCDDKPTLAPFDINLAKQGKPVCTRDGRKARVICFDKKKDIYPLIALVSDKDGYEIITPYKADGVHPTIPNNDLMMVPKKKEGWVNIYYEHDASSHREASWVYDKEEEAIKVGKEHGSCYIATVRIEWEE